MENQRVPAIFIGHAAPRRTLLKKTNTIEPGIISASLFQPPGLFFQSHRTGKPRRPPSPAIIIRKPSTTFGDFHRSCLPWNTAHRVLLNW